MIDEVGGLHDHRLALAGDDASRLVYRAEIVLDETARTLPAGLPLTATPVTGDAR